VSRGEQKRTTNDRGDKKRGRIERQTKVVGGHREQNQTKNHEQYNEHGKIPETNYT